MLWSRHLLMCLLVAIPAGALGLNFSSSDENTGREFYDQITSQIPIYADPKLTDYVDALGQKLVAHSDMPKEKFTFTVLDSPDINAFATPGGFIYVNRGLIAYLSSEAQLAAVVAHEIAHVTKRHAARQNRAQTTSNIAATVLAVLARSGEVGEATAMWGAASVRGYGREMELEADAVGAQYIASAGYDRSAVIEVISLLKDNERFEKRKARETGAEPSTYHGLFATHPRNDKRLQEIVQAAGGQKSGEQGQIPFRLATDQLVWGENFQAKMQRDFRLLDESRLFRVDFPRDWQFSQDSSGTITATGPDQSAGMTIEIARRSLKSPEAYIKEELGISPIRKSQGFKQYGLPGHTGLTDGTSGGDTRLAVVYYRHYALIFRGDAPDKEADETALNIIHSFAPVSSQQLRYQEPLRINYVKANANTTFAALAAHLKLGDFGEETLRIINGHYPRGEPQAGEWIKIIR
jgi:predicted Zn-dependent protease